ncbi:MAG TPA: PEGA domain-containing protein [Candidatus Binataceae bacterium]|nr:PEGA domain-containing protein [Candidatus Binataceae bacterium]
MNRIAKRSALALATAAVLLNSSCATLIHGGGTQTISISTEPPGATVAVGGQQIIAPADVTLDRNRNYQIIATKEGYATATSTLQSRFSWVTILDLIFIIPWVVDLVSGGAYNLSPDTVSLVLAPKVAAPPPVAAAPAAPVPAAPAPAPSAAATPVPQG